MAALGVVSYGFYFIHALYLTMFLNRRHHVGTTIHTGVPLAVAAFALTYGLAWLSFRYIESPFLKLKKRLAPGHRSVPSGLEEPVFVGDGLTVRNGLVGAPPPMGAA